MHVVKNFSLSCCSCIFVHLCSKAHRHDCKVLVFGPRRNVRAYIQALIRRNQGPLTLKELCQCGTASRLREVFISVSVCGECQKFDLCSSPIFTSVRFHCSSPSLTTLHTMQALHHSALHSDLPENVTKPDVTTYKYSVPDHTAPCSTAQASPPSVTSAKNSQLASSQRDFTRWPLLLLSALVLAITAGVGGGFVGTLCNKYMRRKGQSRQKVIFSQHSTAEHSTTKRTISLVEI